MIKEYAIDEHIPLSKAMALRSWRLNRKGLYVILPLLNNIQRAAVCGGRASGEASLVL